ncbi:Brix domain-containing protein [Delphinella strobiligena]|nr:Brix domain-containing protein [Delphinella strobiligena]
MLKAVKPKNARSKRAMEKKAPQVHENHKMTLFLKYTSTSEIVNLAMTDLHSLKRPLCVKFNKKNDIHPFEDASSLEFFAEKNDASLMVFGSHSKKRPNTVTFARMFDYKVLEMMEMHIDPETFRSLSQFKNAKARVGLKPLISFSGTAFDSPTANAYTQAKSLLMDFFKGEDTANVDVEGLQYMIHVSVPEEVENEAAPKIQFRTYMIKTKKSGQSLPRVEVEEMGPRIDFRVGRVREADSDMLKEAMRKPKGTEARTKKNIETDIVGDKVGRVHVGKQDMKELQTRKMKGLKRSRGEDDGAESVDEEEGGVEVKKARA